MSKPKTCKVCGKSSVPKRSMSTKYFLINSPLILITGFLWLIPMWITAPKKCRFCGAKSFTKFDKNNTITDTQTA